MLKLSGLILIVFSTYSIAGAENCNSNALSENLSSLRDAAYNSTSSLTNPGKSEFCRVRQNRSKLAQLIRDERNLFSFNNDGGFLGLPTGVCWWHSRLQRRMSYLADFRVDLPKPSEKQVKKILRQIKRGKNVVTIPGYANLAEFSTAYSQEIQKSLNAWAFGDTLFRQQWINGFRGKTNISPEKMKDHLESMYINFQEANGPQVQILQLPGLEAHAWILNDMNKISDTEYKLEVIDSNKASETFIYSVFTQSTNMTPKAIIGQAAPDFIAYSKYDDELKTLQKAVSNYCTDKIFFNENDNRDYL